MGVTLGAFSVTVLGCDGGYQAPGGACSGYLVRAGSTRLLLDSGPGTIANLQRYVGLDELDAVVLSHDHPDHWSDIEGLAVARQYALSAPVGVPADSTARERVRVLAPKGLREITYHCRGDAFDWREVTDGSKATVGALELRFSRTDHGPETLGVRVSAFGRVLAYSADTGPKWSLGRLGGGIDVGLCEATFTSAHEGSARHLSARQAGTQARDAAVRRLVVTHRWPVTIQVPWCASRAL
ncbi:MAG: MBL fold metallo-hydrolase [Acidimicrobiales bacterium]